MKSIGDEGNQDYKAGFREAVSFWEPLRIWYSAILALVLIAWMTFSWPHFRGAVDSLFIWLVVFLALANAGYCAGYFAEVFIQALVTLKSRRRVRKGVWTLGMLFSLLIENYWIADEIYPYQDHRPKAAQLFGGGLHLMSAHFATNLNLPAPLAVVGFLAAVGGLFLAVASILIFWFARKPKFMRWTTMAIGCGATIYFALLVGFSVASHSRILPVGQEKYFCEIDCHLAYSVVAVKEQPGGASTDYVVTLRTRFDETTTSPGRPKDAPLVPSPREVRLIDNSGREYAPVSTNGTALMTPIRPADSYTTTLDFKIPKEASGLRLLVNTIPGWPDHVVIGDENSWLHKKTYFAL
jgi:hypothetical protein